MDDIVVIARQIKESIEGSISSLGSTLTTYSNQLFEKRIFPFFQTKIEKDKENTDSIVNAINGKEEINASEISNPITKELKSVNDSIKNIKIPEPKDFPEIIMPKQIDNREEINKVSKTIKEEIGKINPEIIINNNQDKLIEFFKNRKDKAELLKAIKELKDKIKTPNNYTDILEEISDKIKDTDNSKIESLLSTVSKTEDINIIVEYLQVLIEKPLFNLNDFSKNDRIKVEVDRVGGGSGGSSGVVYNKEMEQVNPSTEDKQDDLIARTQDVQNPIPTDGDSVYAKDIDIAGSEIGTFTGNIESLFNDYDVEIIDVSATNPKTFTVKFKRPISTNQVAFGSKTGDLSNVKIQFKDMGGAVRGEIDDSTNNAKYTSQIYPFITPAGVIGKVVFIEMVVEFHTADEVKINGSFIPKLLQQESLIMGYDDSTGLPTYGKFDNGEFIVGGKVGLKDSSNNNIDPATEQKQDEIINTIQGNYIFQYKEDSTDSKILYFGEAEIGSTVSQAAWKIQRWDTTTGAIKLYADGDKEFDNIFDDRETLTYS